MPTHIDPTLPPFPWLVPAEPAQAAAEPHGRKTGQDSILAQCRAGLTAAAVAICGGTACVSLLVLAQPRPAADLPDQRQAAVTAVISAPLDLRATENAVPMVTPAPIIGDTTLPAVLVKPTSQAEPHASAISAPPAARPAIATEAAPVIVSPPTPAAESPVSAATVAEFWSVIDECRETARLVIALANRQRPGRNASAQELTDDQLRRQNAEAARDYRKYLDKLARSMRGSTTQTVGQEVLERAQQTRGYLTTMLADSQASLR